ncbi:hypothetical protein BB560_001012 [Smittium megazygosporum]|uniref:Ints3-like C-terminal domain-containing protein n=1 Tax=Smittium megazygosporum TaxID=133381 RepID=A0A2T9ZIW3_9FUNG|nr:hypothetical protein BB560_001012 [Smittium megazygosporum]
MRLLFSKNIQLKTHDTMADSAAFKSTDVDSNLAENMAPPHSTELNTTENLNKYKNTIVSNSEIGTLENLDPRPDYIHNNVSISELEHVKRKSGQSGYDPKNSTGDIILTLSPGADSGSGSDSGDYERKAKKVKNYSHPENDDVPDFELDSSTVLHDQAGLGFGEESAESVDPDLNNVSQTHTDLLNRDDAADTKLSSEEDIGTFIEDDNSAKYISLLEKHYEDPSLWIFGSVPKELGNSVIENEEDVANLKLKELYSMYIETEVLPSAVGRLLGLIFKLSNLEDVEMNLEFESSGNQESVEHDLVYTLCELILDNYSTFKSKNLFISDNRDISSLEDYLSPAIRKSMALIHFISTVFEPFGFRWYILTSLVNNMPELYFLYASNCRLSVDSTLPLEQIEYPPSLDEQSCKENFLNKLTFDMSLFRESFEVLFYQSLTTTFKQFPSGVVGNHKLVLVITSSILQPQLHQIIYSISTNNLRLFGNEPSKVLLNTFDVDTNDQINIWQMLKFEILGNLDALYDIIDCFISYKDLDWSVQTEAANGLLSILTSFTPNSILLDKIIHLCTLHRVQTSDSSLPDHSDSNITKNIPTYRFPSELPLYSNTIPTTVVLSWAKSFPEQLIFAFKSLADHLHFNASLPKLHSSLSLVLAFIRDLKKSNPNNAEYIERLTVQSPKLALKPSIISDENLIHQPSKSILSDTKNMIIQRNLNADPQVPNFVNNEQNQSSNFQITQGTLAKSPQVMQNILPKGTVKKNEASLCSNIKIAPRPLEAGENILNLNMIRQANTSIQQEDPTFTMRETPNNPTFNNFLSIPYNPHQVTEHNELYGQIINSIAHNSATAVPNSSPFISNTGYNFINNSGPGSIPKHNQLPVSLNNPQNYNNTNFYPISNLSNTPNGLNSDKVYSTQIEATPFIQNQNINNMFQLNGPPDMPQNPNILNFNSLIPNNVNTQSVYNTFSSNDNSDNSGYNTNTQNDIFQSQLSKMQSLNLLNQIEMQKRQSKYPNSDRDFQ